MRLTLRALLAYLYNVLDPEDADEFAGKVKESAVASGLVQRIGGITRKLRMGAPRVDAKGTDDANNVAEYLDNSLSEEQVGDFERACINSDMHLAEVASSYQVLTMVLGKAAEIPPALRERIYALPLEIAISHKDGGDGDGPDRQRLKKTIEKVAKSAKDAGAAKSVRTGSTHPVPEVPAYLRQPQKSRTLLGLAIAAIVVVLVLIGIRAAGPFDASNPIIGWMYKPSTQMADAKGERKASDERPSSGDVEKDKKNKEAEAAAKKANDKATPAVSEDDQTADVPKKSSTADAEDKSSAPPAPAKNSAKSKDDGGLLPPPPPAPDEPEPPATSSKGSDVKGTTEGSKKGTAAATTKPPAPVDPMDVGRFVSDDQVLARYNPRSAVWLSVPSREILASGDRLIVLPTYRPQIALGSGVQVSFEGESLVQLEEPQQAGASRMTVEHGRFLVLNFGKKGAQLELNLQGLAGTLTLEDSDTIVAIDVRHFLPPGASDEMDARVLVIEMFATSGSAKWEEAEHEPVEIPAHHVLTYLADKERELTGPFQPPAWIDATGVPDIDRMTSLEIKKVLDPAKPIHVTLAELVGDRRVDMRSLAARFLVSLGQFDPLIKELNNPQQRTFWASEVDVLRQSLSRGGETAVEIRQSLERLRPQEAATLYRLLWGYSPEQLAGDGAKELVALLESPEMDVRVLASDTLRQITGAQLYYRPEKPPADNRLSINRWRERLDEGGIAYMTQPAPLPEYKPLAPAEGTKAGAAKAKAAKDEK
jgi:hypothetical protein